MSMSVHTGNALANTPFFFTQLDPDLERSDLDNGVSPISKYEYPLPSLRHTIIRCSDDSPFNIITKFVNADNIIAKSLPL